MLPTPYPELNAVLDELVGSARRVLKDNFVAAALQGSFAVGDFDDHSDVDWIVVTEQELADSERRALQAVHQRIYDLDSEWAKHLEGSYIPRRILHDYTLSGTKVWYLDHGSRVLERSDHDNTIVVRWILREQGVALAGPVPAELIDPIPVEALRQEILAVINDWGAEILADSERINNRFYQAFAVLSYCRMLHDLDTGQVGSKRAGAEWAKVNLEPSWSDLIDRAWDGRPNPAVSVRQPADPADLDRTLTFIKYVMKKSNEFAAAMQAR